MGLLGRSERRWPLWPLAEPAVALTDWALAVECACCVAALARGRSDEQFPRRAGFAFFGATGVAAILGGIVHGYFPDDQPHRWQSRLWGATLLALGAAGAAAWTIAARVAFTPPRTRPILALGALGYAAYSGIILAGRRQFAVAVAGYLPANLFLLGAFADRYRRRRDRASAQALGGIALTLLASGIQQRRVALHPRYADHNTLYHLVMGVALPLFCAGLRGVGTALRASDE